MHSRIFQVDCKPINKEDYITESDFWEHWFTREWADYVAESNRDDDIKWITRHGKDKGIQVKKSKGEYTLTVTDKLEYFSHSFERFKKALDELNKKTIEEFCNGDMQMWELNDAYHDKGGFYISYGEELFTLDEFVRNAEKGDIYYLGGTLDYHW